MRTPTQEAFLSIIRYEIAGTPLPDGFNVPDMDELIELSEKQDLTHLVYDALTRNGIPCSSEKAFKQYYAAMWRVEQMDHEFGRISDLLENNGIDFVPLKGSVIRSLYPERWMRTSSDIDLLFRAEQEKTAEELMVQELGYEYAESNGSIVHGNLFSPVNHVHVEPHRTLFQDLNINGHYVEFFSDIWKRALTDPEGQGHRYKLSDADAYAYHIAHMMKHFFRFGGCAVRGLIDLWLLDRIPDADRDARARMIADCGLSRFEAGLKKLICTWMDGRPVENEYLEQYVLAGYMYGTFERSAGLKANQKGKLGYLLGRVFLPFDQLKALYPILEKHPYLLPVMWLRRWVKLVGKDGVTNFEKQMKVIKNIDRSTLKDLNDLSEYLGL